LLTAVLLPTAAVGLFWPINGRCVAIHPLGLPWGETLNVIDRVPSLPQWVGIPLYAVPMSVSIYGLIAALRSVSGTRKGWIRDPWLFGGALMATIGFLLTALTDFLWVRLPYFGNIYFYGVFYVLVDIDLVRHYRREQQALMQSEKRHAAIFDSTQDALVLFRDNGKIAVANRAFRQLAGCRQPSAACPCDEGCLSEPAIRQLAAFWESGEPARRIDLELARADAEVVAVDVQTTVIDEGGSSSTLVSCRDINARLRSEFESRQSNHIATIVQVSSGIAHDFNNILQGVIGCAGLLHDSNEPNVRECAITLETASREGMALVSGLLALSKKRNLLAEVYVAGDPIGIAVRLFRAAHRQAPLSIEIGSAASLRLFGAKLDLQNAVLNLLLNARHATRERGAITLSVTHCAPAAGAEPAVDVGQLLQRPYVQIDVADTGCGMSQDVKERCFDAFFTTKGSEGTGIGMGTIKESVIRAEGAMRIVSAVGVGTTVTLWLPVHTPRSGAFVRRAAAT
jgi:signal transduction histidine kinase